MGKIFYGVTGEGRGHATRVRTLVDQLCGDHEVVVYAPAMAYDFLAPLYARTSVSVRKLPGLLFHYNQRGGIALGATAFHTLKYLFNMNGEIDRLADAMREEKPDLVITDFEPILPRAANRCGIPYISIDHQHFLKTYDLSALPLHLRIHASIMARGVGLYYRNQVETIVSSFYFPPLKKNSGNVTQTGVLLRKEVIEAERRDDGHLLVYLRRFISPSVKQALMESGRPVRIYGLGELPSEKNIRYMPIDAHRFVTDLATSSALISTAGNQLLGEALYLGKPSLVMAEKGNHEQEINAWFLNQSGTGIAVPFDDLKGAHIHQFLANLPEYKAAMQPMRINGNTSVLNAIRRYLPETAQTRPVRVRSVLGLQQQVS